MMKLIWYLPIWGQKYTGKELQPILFGELILNPVIHQELTEVNISFLVPLHSGSRTSQ